jgi:hypothetical protein
MGRSYKQCNECGKRALSIATRCPGCGSELLTRVDPEPARRRRLLPPGVAAAVIAAAAVLIVVKHGETSGTPKPRTSPLAADSSVSTEVAYAIAPAESAGELLVARTWTSVRRSRSKAADLAAVLLPGDTVVADSLGRGWYRVALEGEVIGYVHRSTLMPPPSPAAADRPGPQSPDRPRPSP